MKHTGLVLCLISTLLFVGCTKKGSSSSAPSLAELNAPAYQIKEVQDVDSVGAEVALLEHKKSGAQIVLMKNDDPAKTFNVAFRTPPYDDTGLFHIFEHAVLEGSRMYPSKSNFFHVANSSIASFVNATTFPVATLYPIVSKSQKDFDNLMSVYLDAVYFPNVINDPRIIKREGWRYEVDPKTNKMSINGIVLSEMKAHYSNPSTILHFHLGKSLLPQSSYSFESGGLPDLVSTLTFDQIKEAHKKYYHPQNSMIVLYGDLDFAEQLDKIDKTFLSHFTKDPNFIPPEIVEQKNFNYPTDVVNQTYPGSLGPDKDYIAKGYILGNKFTPLEELAGSVMIKAFVDSEASPLRRRILSEGLAKSVYMDGLGNLENGLVFVFEGTKAENKDKIDQVLKEEIAKVASDGLNEKILEAILNSHEFYYKEKNSTGAHRGYQLSFISVFNWLDGRQSLFESLDFVTRYKKLRRLLEQKTFIKDYFKRHLMNNDRTRWVVLTPDPDFSEKFNAGLEKQVQQALKEKDISEYKKEYEQYQDWVASKESPEILAKTPTLDLQDITADEAPIEFQTQQKENHQLVTYPQSTGGIYYLDLYFDLQGVPEESLKNLGLFTGFIQRTNTENYNFQQLVTELGVNLGGLSFSASAYQSIKDPQKYRPILNVSAKFLEVNSEKAIELIIETLTKHQFSPVSQLQDLLAEQKTSLQANIAWMAPSLASRAATRDFFTNMSRFNDEVDGSRFINYLLNESIDASELSQNLRQIGQQVFNKKRLVRMSLVAPKNNLSDFSQSAEKIYQALPAGEDTKPVWTFANQAFYDAYIIPGELQFINVAAPYQAAGLSYDGSMEAFGQYMRNHFALPIFREQRGAYGASVDFDRSGLFRFSTYRDPQMRSSLETIGKLPEMVSKEKFTKDTIKPAILGALKPFYRDKSLYDKASTMEYLHFTEQTWDDIITIKKQILATTPEDFSKLSQALGPIMKEMKIGVAGNEARIKKSEGKFKKVLNLK